MAKYDATKPFADNANKEVVDKVRQGFISRLEKALNNKAINKQVAMYYAKWLKEVTGRDSLMPEPSFGNHGDVEGMGTDRVSVDDV